eukprot:TRINITY_DN6629_c0_g1_i1.p1 TRINITY_DN6629_c0_g1~~TRINITY_DN6629_c0_g1_i1.p1  ORF type:complete len:181 (-),score=80.75 TRINITY_DN6629_c0_g1_i1:91-633(-)
MKSATEAQQEQFQYRNNNNNEEEPRTFYKKDVKYCNGLISSAQNISSSVSDLVASANNIVNNNGSEEELIAASRQVAANCTSLVVSSRVRATKDSSHQIELENASKSVTKATSILVNAVKTITESSKKVIQQNISSELQQLTKTESKIKEMEEQVNILRLEKELETSRIKLAQIRKSNYQ